MNEALIHRVGNDFTTQPVGKRASQNAHLIFSRCLSFLNVAILNSGECLHLGIQSRRAIPVGRILTFYRATATR